MLPVYLKCRMCVGILSIRGTYWLEKFTSEQIHSFCSSESRRPDRNSSILIDICIIASAMPSCVSFTWIGQCRAAAAAASATPCCSVKALPLCLYAIVLLLSLLAIVEGTDHCLGTSSRCHRRSPREEGRSYKS